ncbi:hypothetical protein BDA96_02G011500 [Sorghum bicolor]|uniref:Uncharacterized protein n=2 Tax=Sorghum bicolor TaxID=4558 RepID=C5X7B7_SORBI|nr:hypothetical protein SORBI_3002G010900 [Sorghum bicolor]KAG0541379.1 hypothetical protein BDA96_02G011500 [Sorghum bicolor]
MSSSCLLPPPKRVWRGIRARLGLRPTTTTTGLGRLQKEVRTCEYSDVHVMWEMLSKQPTTGVRDDDPPPSPPARTGRAAAAWSRLASYCCAL